MSATETAKTAVGLSQIVNEGYGTGAWHGPDLRAAVGDVTAAQAFWRPSAERHTIAEIALHHAFVLRGVRAQLSGEPPEPFVLDGDDWFVLPDETVLSWSKVRDVLAKEQQRLRELVETIEVGRSGTSADLAERGKLVLGATCHAVYHAGQIQLLKRLRPE